MAVPHVSPASTPLKWAHVPPLCAPLSRSRPWPQGPHLRWCPTSRPPSHVPSPPGPHPQPCPSLGFTMHPPIAHTTPQCLGSLVAFVCMPHTCPWCKGHGTVGVACGLRQVMWVMRVPQHHPMCLHGSAPPACAPQPSRDQRARSKAKGPIYNPLPATPTHSGHPVPHASASCTRPVLGHFTHYGPPVAAPAPPPVCRPPTMSRLPPPPGPTYMPWAPCLCIRARP